MDEIKFLHGSDTHIDRKEYRINLHHRLETIKLNYPRHHLIWTGDETDNGDIDEYQLTARLIRGYVVCPGNHDYGEFGWFKQWSKAKMFDKIFGTRYASSQMPQVDIIDDRVALIGLNSNPLAWQFWLSFARGNVGRRQRRNLAAILNKHKDKTRIVYAHHHFFLRDYFMKMKDANKVMRILQCNCEALLMGHGHRQELYPRMGYGIPLIHAAGALYEETEALEIIVSDESIKAKYVSII